MEMMHWNPPIFINLIFFTPVEHKSHVFVNFSSEFYIGLPELSKSTRPPTKTTAQLIVNNIIEDPARVPIPTPAVFCGLSPNPLKRTMAPSGTAPKIGMTIVPIISLYLVNMSNSLPADIISAPKYKKNP